MDWLGKEIVNNNLLLEMQGYINICTMYMASQDFFFFFCPIGGEGEFLASKSKETETW